MFSGASSTGTFVSLPLSQYPRSPAKFLQYQWARYRSWLEGSLSVLQVKLRSMPSWTRRPRWRAARRRIAPAAKALYREVLEAFAQGDRATLSRVCVRAFGTRLIAAVDRRSPRERVRFDLVRYNRPLLYPRLLSHRIHAVNPHDRDSATEQAVVAIASTQQASRHSFDTGALIPGSLKLQDKIEYVVLSRNLNVKTYESSPWRVWGTTSATSLDEYVKEQAALEKEQAQRAGF
ncbi:hypothetical protein CDD83_7592 [Cordyceps sp. RAO-2017]|nr:hypothetical protein CDD83_7592 [Cordyceps sp. RAO-2017]